MKHARLIAVTLAFALAMMGGAFSATAAEPIKGVEIEGKCTVKSETKDGKTSKTCSVTVTSAKGSDGKPIADLAGKTLTCTGAKAADCEKHSGKTIVAKGTVSADKKNFEIESCSVKDDKKS